MYTVFPCISECLNLLGLSSNIFGVSIFYISIFSTPLKVRIKLNPIRRVKINTLHFPPQPFPLRQTSHHL